MKVAGPRRVIACMLSALLLLSSVAPAATYAAQPNVDVENHTSRTGDAVITDVRVDEVDAPQAGKDLDDTAKVACAGGQTWEIPVLWVSDDLELATRAQEGHTYLPVLAYFVPAEYRVEGAGYTVTLSDSLAKLFGDNDVISVYDDATGVTYILPSQVRSLFERARRSAVAGPVRPAQATDVAQDIASPSAVDPDDAAAGEPGNALVDSPADNAVPGDGGPSQPDRVDLYCSKTARDALSYEDLDYLIDLIVNRLQPQAVNLLMDRFPAFAEAGRNGQLSRNIGLYVYFENGDKDGIPEHENAPAALAYVNGDVNKQGDGSLAYGLLLGVDASSLVKRDANGNFVRTADGKCALEREGKRFDTFVNTVVHEMFHAFMDDYNRVGMLGARNVTEGYTPNGRFVSPEQQAAWNALSFPKWFREGTASACENNYQFRYDFFRSLRASMSDPQVYEGSYARLSLLYNYINGRDVDGDPLRADLIYAAGSEGYVNARYCSGYLAVLYLSELAARANSSLGSSITVTDAGFKINSERLTLGLNDILANMRSGVTLDQVIRTISPKDASGNPIYASEQDFVNKFIKGVPDETDTYHGDDASMEFTLTFLNYMRGLEEDTSYKHLPNGSFLYDFDVDFVLPLDPNKEGEADHYKIDGANTSVPTSVPDSVAFVGAGKSDPPPVSAQDGAPAEPAATTPEPATEPQPAQPPAAEQPAAEAPAAEPQPTELPLAAKQGSDSVEHVDIVS